MLITYVSLLLLAIILAITTIIWDDIFAIKIYGPNLITEVIGILITLFIVEQIISHQKAKEQKRVARGAARKSATALEQIVLLFTQMVKGSLQELPDPPPATVRELFSPEITDSLECLDLASSEVPFGENWAEYATRVLYDNLKRIRWVIDTYITFLPSAYVEALDEIHDHEYINLIRSLPGVIRENQKRGAEGNPYPLSDARDWRNDFFEKLARAVELHNDEAEKAINVPDMLTLDYHLPSVGSLRTDRTEDRGKPGIYFWL